MKKVLLLTFGKIEYMPYISFYTDIFRGSEIHLVCWNRDGINAALAPHGITRVYEYNRVINDTAPTSNKAPAFLCYRKFVNGILKRNNFDCVAALFPPAVMLWDILIKKYHAKYILDFRDATRESNKIIQHITKELAENAMCVFASSKGFTRFIPYNGVVITHNISSRLERKIAVKSAEKIRIRFWGLIRNFQVNRALIDSIVNDSRFELHYHGNENDTSIKLAEYCSRINAVNISFHGKYASNERSTFACETDILDNLYDFDGCMQYAMSNKLYDGIAFHLPQICMPETEMGNYVQKNDIGFVCSPYDDNYADKLYNYYVTINRHDFEQKCESLYDEIISEYNSAVEYARNIMDG